MLLTFKLSKRPLEFNDNNEFGFETPSGVCNKPCIVSKVGVATGGECVGGLYFSAVGLLPVVSKMYMSLGFIGIMVLKLLLF
jgi:hypothetical protein